MRKIRQERVPRQAWWLTPACGVLGSLRQAEFETSLGLQETISKSKVTTLGRWAAIANEGLTEEMLSGQKTCRRGGRELSSSRNQWEASSRQSQEDRKS